MERSNVQYEPIGKHKRCIGGLDMGGCGGGRVGGSRTATGAGYLCNTELPSITFRLGESRRRNFQPVARTTRDSRTICMTPVLSTCFLQLHSLDGRRACDFYRQRVPGCPYTESDRGVYKGAFLFVSHPPPVSFRTDKNELFFQTGDMSFGTRRKFFSPRKFLQLHTVHHAALRSNQPLWSRW